ncbi:MAG: DNA polymerase/3'-5' exonuclease PolX [Candidatus Omnitrophota bacterium]
MDNLEVADIFKQIAKILELKNDNPFRIRAYQRAALTIESLPEGLENYIQTDRLEEIPGIGKDLAAKIKEIVASGRLKFYEDLRETVPEGLIAMLDIPSLGPKTVGLIYRKLNISTIDELEAAAKTGRLLKLEGVREKTVSNILAGIEIVRKGKERISLGKALMAAEDILKQLSKLKDLKQIMFAGSLRRMKETVRDIDILAVSSNPQKVIDNFVAIKGRKRTLAKGQTKASLLTNEDIQVDLRVVEPKSFGAALMYLTGSKNFNIKLRYLALKRNLKINEYGVFSVKGRVEKFVAGKSEEEIFKLLGLSFVVPELREDRGEIELALKNNLPKLIELSDIKGDLHVHSNFSDGANSISEMAAAAKRAGYQYVAVTDHSQGLKVARGLSLETLKKKRREIDKLNEKFSPFRILYGTEVDIDNTGNLDYPQKTLAEFDIVVGAIHSGFKQAKKQLTQRIINACKKGRVNIIAHPTGKLWGVREPYQIDLEEVSKVARDTGIALEINSFPDRLDLNDVDCRLSKGLGAKFAVNTDAHDSEQLAFMRLGVATARRGWLEKKDCINTLSLSELLKVLKK